MNSAARVSKFSLTTQATCPTILSTSSYQHISRDSNSTSYVCLGANYKIMLPRNTPLICQCTFGTHYPIISSRSTSAIQRTRQSLLSMYKLTCIPSRPPILSAKREARWKFMELRRIIWWIEELQWFRLEMARWRMSWILSHLEARSCVQLFLSGS